MYNNTARSNIIDPIAENNTNQPFLFFADLFTHIFIKFFLIDKCDRR
jgi:hypothetical protein